MTASTGSPATSAAIAKRLADNYVAGVALDTKGQYDLAVAAVDSQLASLSTQIADNRAEQARNGEASDGPLQQRLLTLQSQSSDLTIQRQTLLVQRRTSATSTRVVSVATADSAAVGISTTSLAVYGAVLGLALVLCWVALTTTPGRAVDLEGSGDIHGVPILGVLNPIPRGRKLPGMARGAERAYVRNLRVAGELSRIIQLKGPVLVAVAGGERSARQVEHLLNPLVQKRAQPPQQVVVSAPRAGSSPSSPGSAIATVDPKLVDLDNMVTVVPLVSLLQQRPPEQVVVLAVDVDRMKRVDVDEVLASLRTFGADILGIVGTR